MSAGARLATATIACLFRGGAIAGAVSEELLLADLPDEVLASVRAAAAEREPAAPGELLERVLEAGPRRGFEAGPLSVEADPRWFSARSGEGPGAPLLELRRWPGDSVVVFYAVETADESDPNRIVPGATLAPREEAGGTRRWEGTLATAHGGRPALWLERDVEASGRKLCALLLPGDAGLGPGGVASVTEEMLALFRRARTRAEGWTGTVAIGPGDRATVPVTGPSPGDGDERRDPWSVVTAEGFTIGVPPGILARRLPSEPPPPRPLPGVSLWLRGRFVDRDGRMVALGDGSRAGYVAVVESPSRGWSEGTEPPRLCPRAVRVDGRPLDPLITDWTGARAGRVDHFKEPGWEGDWLVFRLVFVGQGIEVGLPVETGWRSLALFWIPFTWRPQGRPPAPPPLDPAERFGIRFLPLPQAERRRNPFVEGTLHVPGLRAVVPRGWWPVASLRTADGFPVRVVSPDGDAALRLTRLRAGAPELGSLAERGWTALRRTQGAAAVYRRADGFLFVSREGHAFLLEVDPDRGAPAGTLERVAESVELSRR